MQETEEMFFTDVGEAVNRLKLEGWKISRSGFYRSQASGKIRRQNGVYTLTAIKKYAKTFLRRRDPAIILREILLQELIKLAPEIVTLVDGDPGKSENLTEYFKRSLAGG